MLPLLLLLLLLLYKMMMRSCRVTRAAELQLVMACCHLVRITFL
jgi:hypothetical protein